MTEEAAPDWRRDLQRLERVAVPALDEILGDPFPVLSDGFVRVVDYMGNDAAVVQAARVSYGEGTKEVHDDRGLIRYLMRHRHTTPNEMCELKLHVRVPMDAWRQWIRHRTANVNEYSTRYSIAIDSADSTPPDGWRTQATGNRQGSGDFLNESIGQELSDAETAFQTTARTIYEDRINLGVAREQARKDLPLSTYTEAYWKIDLHNLLHFLSLRMDSHAQKEIRDYAVIIGEQVLSRWLPTVWEAFQDYRLNAMFLSRLDVDVLACLGAGNPAGALASAESFGWLRFEDGRHKVLKNRERDEFEAKAARLGIVPPWRTAAG